MDFKELLKSQELTDEQVEAIITGMKDNKIYTTSEENLDERYSKAKTKKEDLEAELTKANETIADLKKANKDNEDLQTKIAEHEETIESLQTQSIEKAKDSAINYSLLKYGARNPKAVVGLLDKEKIEVTDDGVKGLEEQLEALKTSDDYLFQGEDDKTTVKIVDPEDPGDDDELDAFQQVLENYN